MSKSRISLVVMTRMIDNMKKTMYELLLNVCSKGKSSNLLFHAFINSLSHPIKGAMMCNHVTI